MDKIAFLKSAEENTRLYFAIDYALKQKDWFDYNQYFQAICEDAIQRRNGNKKSQGKPSDTTKCIRYLIKMGFLEADPILGLRVNENFIPVSQK